jgi:hypothetical protein
MLKFSLYALTALVIIGAVAFLEGTTGGTRSDSPVMPASYQGECTGSTPCSREEVQELWEDYDNECLKENCSISELSSMAGGPRYIDPMFVAFLTHAWPVSTSNFQSEMSPPKSQVWWYTGCNYTGLVTATDSDVTSMPNNFNNEIEAFKLGASISNTLVFKSEDYNGDSQKFPAGVSCLQQSYPAWSNAIQSSKLNDTGTPAGTSTDAGSEK